MGAERAGKIEVSPTVRLESREDLARYYTPGVGDEVRRVADDPSAVDEVTGRANSIFIVTDGSAILGLGDVGAQAGLPVMEGKAALFKTFAGVDAWPLCVSVRDVDDVVRTVAAVASGVGGINVEDVAAPRCFEIVRRLQEELDIPVFHDDQHGTAIVVLAALTNALRVAEKKLEGLRVVVSGAGAAGSAVSRLLLHAGVGDVVVCDSKGALGPDRDDLEGEKKWLAEHTNGSGASGSLGECVRAADVFVGVSAPDLLDRDYLASMADRAIAFGLANPDPEFDPRDVPDNVAVVATGRSDYPNQINNVLAFPGVFRGLLDGDVRTVDLDVQATAAEAIAGLVDAGALGPEVIVPDVFDDRLVPAVAQAVASR